MRAWKAEHPGAAVIAYINTSAEVKAEADSCCTSSNAVKIVEEVAPDREILFLPDMFLGDYVRRKTGRKMHLWVGDCPVHARLRPEALDRARHDHPGAPIIAHPECGCASQVLPQVDRVLSTDGMVRFAEETRAPEVVVATEVGILHRMRRLNPTTRFTPLDAGAICPYMKEIDLTDIRDSLALLQHRIDVAPEVAAKARRALERMVAHPEVVKTIDNSIRRIKDAGGVPGILTGDAKLAQRYIEAGCLFTAVGSDIGLLANAADQLAQTFRSQNPGR